MSHIRITMKCILKQVEMVSSAQEEKVKFATWTHTFTELDLLTRSNIYDWFYKHLYRLSKGLYQDLGDHIRLKYTSVSIVF